MQIEPLFDLSPAMIGIPGGAVAQVALGAKVGANGTMGWYCVPDLEVLVTVNKLLVCSL